MTSLIFPGQGSQFVGMAKDFYDEFRTAKNVFDIIENSTKIDVKGIIFENKDNLLDITQFTQISIFCASMSIYKVFEELTKNKNLKINYSLGHSLGEYSSLVASNVISLDDCAKILKLRGELMQNSYEQNKSGMAAIIGFDSKSVEEIILKNHLNVEIANDNSPMQVVISGKIEDLNTAEPIIISSGAKKFVKLNVSSAFHSRLMIEAERKLALYLESIDFNEANFSIISNFTGSASQDIKKLFQNVSNQMSNRVRWTESIKNLEKLGERKIIEIGPGKVLSGLIKRISNNFEFFSINSVKDMEKILNEL